MSAARSALPRTSSTASAACSRACAADSRSANGCANMASIRTARVLHRLFALASEIHGFPRHLSQHVGGFVISEKPLHHLVPVENAAMPNRTIIQWDKDDLETMKLLKVDCLALGMLTCLRKCLDLLHAHGLWNAPTIGPKPSLVDIPAHDDEHVYDDDLQGGHGRRVPDRIARADVDAAAPEAALFLRSRRRDRDRAARPDPGQHGSSLPAPQAGTGSDRLSAIEIRTRFGNRRVARQGCARTHARRADLPGTGDEADPGRRRFHAR